MNTDWKSIWLEVGDLYWASILTRTDSIWKLVVEERETSHTTLWLWQGKVNMEVVAAPLIYKGNAIKYIYLIAFLHFYQTT